MSGPSLTHQVKFALEGLLAIGQSRHAAKGAGEAAAAIHAWGTYRTYLGRCCTFVHWARDAYGVRRLVELDAEMVLGYVDDLRARERADGYIRGVLSALRKLEAGINRRWRAGLALVPEDLSAEASEPRFGYALGDARRLIAWVAERDPEAALVLRVQLAAGLRLDEALHLRADKVWEDSASVEMKGKGGRVRMVALLDPDVLAEFPTGGTYVFSPTASFRRRVQAGCEVLGLRCKGTHGFRATFAERLLALEMARGRSEREARKAVSTALGHNRVAVTLRYVPKGKVEGVSDLPGEKHQRGVPERPYNSSTSSPRK